MHHWLILYALQALNLLTDVLTELASELGSITKYIFENTRILRAILRICGFLLGLHFTIFLIYYLYKTSILLLVPVWWVGGWLSGSV